MIITLIGTGFQIFLWAYMFLDKGWDTLVRMFLGHGFLKFFAYLAIWGFKLPTMPIIIFGWAWTVLISSMAFPISGWMILFKGSGCFLRWGHNCHFPDGKRFKDRSYWEIADLAWLMKFPTDSLRLPPSYSEFSKVYNHDLDGLQKMELFKLEGKKRRQEVMEQSPFMLTKELLSDIGQYIAM